MRRRRRSRWPASIKAKRYNQSYAASPGEALSREQALLAYTTGGAFAEHRERDKGCICVGMAADLALLSQDILVAPVPDLPATRSLLTLVDGKVVHEDAGLADPMPGK